MCSFFIFKADVLYLDPRMGHQILVPNRSGTTQLFVIILSTSCVQMDVISGGNGNGSFQSRADTAPSPPVPQQPQIQKRTLDVFIDFGLLLAVGKKY
jgi:hypothetical protein